MKKLYLGVIALISAMAVGTYLWGSRSVSLVESDSPARHPSSNDAATAGKVSPNP